MTETQIPAPSVHSAKPKKARTNVMQTATHRIRISGSLKFSLSFSQKLSTLTERKFGSVCAIRAIGLRSGSGPADQGKVVNASVSTLVVGANLDHAAYGSAPRLVRSARELGICRPQPCCDLRLGLWTYGPVPKVWAVVCLLCTVARKKLFQAK